MCIVMFKADVIIYVSRPGLRIRHFKDSIKLHCICQLHIRLCMHVKGDIAVSIAVVMDFYNAEPLLLRKIYIYIYIFFFCSDLLKNVHLP